jgi:hypothetical protein
MMLNFLTTMKMLTVSLTMIFNLQTIEVLAASVPERRMMINWLEIKEMLKLN